MARNVFFSFHYDLDAWRVNVVRNSQAITHYGKSTFFRDKAEWEKIKRNGPTAVKKWIDEQMSGTSVTVVLIGAETGRRSWVKYEVEQTLKLGHGLLGVDISKIKNQQKQTTTRGPSPLPAGYPMYLWNNGKGAENLGTWIEKAARAAGR